MNFKILALFTAIPLLLMAQSSSYAISGSDQMMMKDSASMKKSMSMSADMEKIRHMQQTDIPNPIYFKIDDTTIKINRGSVTISGHGAYNPEKDLISAWGAYSISMGSRVINGNWKATNLVSGNGNPFGGSSDDSHVHFVGKTASFKDPKFTGHNAKRESIKRGGHQLWISADAAEGKLCVYGKFVGTPSPRNACVETNTITITK